MTFFSRLFQFTKSQIPSQQVAPSQIFPNDPVPLTPSRRLKSIIFSNNEMKRSITTQTNESIFKFKNAEVETTVQVPIKFNSNKSNSILAKNSTQVEPLDNIPKKVAHGNSLPEKIESPVAQLEIIDPLNIQTEIPIKAKFDLSIFKRRPRNVENDQPNISDDYSNYLEMINNNPSANRPRKIFIPITQETELEPELKPEIQQQQQKPIFDLIQKSENGENAEKTVPEVKKYFETKITTKFERGPPADIGGFKYNDYDEELNKKFIRDAKNDNQRNNNNNRNQNNNNNRNQNNNNRNQNNNNRNQNNNNRNQNNNNRNQNNNNRNPNNNNKNQNNNNRNQNNGNYDNEGSNRNFNNQKDNRNNDRNNRNTDRDDGQNEKRNNNRNFERDNERNDTNENDNKNQGRRNVRNDNNNNNNNNNRNSQQFNRNNNNNRKNNFNNNKNENGNRRNNFNRNNNSRGGGNSRGNQKHHDE
ncbi:hypothetical protein TRFO_24910 [Tritrichomonas foetus]|uniref:Uncharacterized protein n=1 Tax=Tritrichomonas foetus TaxID=1144522 RepID=A0A1J4KB78_9EUKA|nr:hypothetical protein TRFO_24910 [Tritrichomonas foetus]|eukprot:OHT06948.1 hypothetical protein TRFO_24910 [Tritrichomonas foetus]